MDENSLLHVPLIDRLQQKPIVEKSRNTKLINLVLIFLIGIVACIRVFSYVTLINNVHMKFKYNDVNVYEDEIIDFTYKGLVFIFWKAGACVMSVLILMGEYLLPFISYLFLATFLLEQNCQYLTKKLPFWRDLLELTVAALEMVSKFSLTDIMIQSILQRVIFTDATLVELSPNSVFGIRLSASPGPALVSSILSTVCLIFLFRLVELNNFSNKKETILFRKIGQFKRYACCLTSSRCRGLFIKLVMSVFCFLSLFSLYKAFTEELLSFRITGIAGNALKEEDAVKSYYLINIPDFLVDTADPTIAILSAILAAYVYITLLFLPVMYSILALIWIVTSIWSNSWLATNILRGCETLLDFSLSNSNLEVTFVAAVACFIELPTMARFLLNELYPLVCTFVHNSDNRLECVDLERAIEPGFYWLLLSVILKQMIISYIYFKRA